MRWFAKKTGKSKIVRRTTRGGKSIVRKRRFSAERIIFFLKRGGVAVGLVVLCGWMLSWYVLSGGAQKTSDWFHDKTLNVTSNSGFTLENIYVEGRHYTDASTLKALLNTEKGDPLFALDVSEAQRFIENLAWVKSVRIERRLPDTLYISLTEREPLALWQYQGKLSLLDKDGKVITTKNLERFQKLPLVVGEGAPDKAPAFLSYILADDTILTKMNAAVLISKRRWNLSLKNQVIVKLPEDNIELALRRLVSAQEDGNLMDKNIREIDMRDTGRIIVRTLPGAVREYKAGYGSSNDEDGI